MISNGNILFTVRKHATYSEEYDFAMTVIAERCLIPFLDDKDDPRFKTPEDDINRQIEITIMQLKDKIRELQQGKGKIKGWNC